MPLLLFSYDLRVYVCYVLFNKYSILLRGPGHAPAQKLSLSLAGSEPRVMHGSLGSHAEQRIDWFGRFGTVQHSSALLSVRSRHAE